MLLQCVGLAYQEKSIKNKKIVKGRNKTVPATEQQIVEECRNLISMKHNKMYLQKLTAFLADFISVFVSCFRKLSGGLLSGFEFLSQDRQFFFLLLDES